MIKQVGATAIRPRHRVSCHCGAMELELSLPKVIENSRCCDCSICRRKGAFVASVPLVGLRIVKGHAALTLYEFHTMTAKRSFCSVCGVYTHYQGRFNSEQYGYNVGCLDGVDPLDLPDVPQCCPG